MLPIHNRHVAQPSHPDESCLLSFPIDLSISQLRCVARDDLRASARPPRRSRLPAGGSNPRVGDVSTDALRHAMRSQHSIMSPAQKIRALQIDRPAPSGPYCTLQMWGCVSHPEGKHSTCQHQAEAQERAHRPIEEASISGYASWRHDGRLPPSQVSCLHSIQGRRERQHE